MSKKTDNPDTTMQTAETPAFLEELLTNGTTILTAKTPEELNEMIDSIPAECRYGAGAVGKNAETGAYTLRIDLIKD